MGSSAALEEPELPRGGSTRSHHFQTKSPLATAIDGELQAHATHTFEAAKPDTDDLISPHGAATTENSNVEGQAEGI